MGDMTLVIGNRNYSSWSLRAWLALKATGADFDEVLIRLGRDDTGERIGALSPNGLVPALHVGGVAIWDSLAIGEYLAEVFPEAHLWPGAPKRRAVARSVAAEMHSGFNAVRSAMPLNIRVTYPAEDFGPDVEADIERITSVWSTCRRNYGGGGDLLFGAFTLADAFYAPVVSRFRTYGVTPTGAAADYMEAVWALPDVGEWVAQAEAEPWKVERYDR